MSSQRIKVLIVEDSIMMQQILLHVLSRDPRIEVIGMAASGMQALEILERLTPDVITIDINMPHMDGLEVTRRIMETRPIPVVIVSASWQPQEVATTFKAMEAGALAVVGKPPGPAHKDHEREARKLIDTVKAMSEVKVVRRWPRSRRAEMPPAPIPRTVANRVEAAAPALKIVAVGASTGGPLVLQTILSRLPKDFPIPLLIVQHIAAGFLDGMVEWLSTTTGFPVHIAGAGEEPRAGCAYLAPDGFHMEVASSGRIVLSLERPDEGLRPSVARLFSSVARVFGPSAAGVLLTGMGRDGASELKMIKDRSGLTIAQDQETSIVFGMPGEAVRIDAATHVLSPERIAGMLQSAAARR
jgi:two-component system chemotaxis response regulator CheB